MRERRWSNKEREASVRNVETKGLHIESVNAKGIEIRIMYLGMCCRVILQTHAKIATRLPTVCEERATIKRCVTCM